MELKLTCDCGQKYKFDVEPANGRMPFGVQCPVCGIDGTSTANTILAQIMPKPSPAPVAAPVPRAVVTSAPARAAVPVATPAHGVTAPAFAAAMPARKPASNSFALGVLGALLGAALGTGLMYGFFLMTDFRFPLLGIGIGALTGYGARLLYRGTDMKLGVVAGAFALIAVAGTLYLMFGGFAVMNIISLAVSVSVAYQIAS
jgi:hypothetical protein